ncbi:MAG: adenosylhomocysteinase [Gammaproteobacteria bacterium]|nr:MAG: adenosylhomocysteinase [Gammaproteobacteria bacterium]
MRYAIKDPSLADRGRERIHWASQEMPVLRAIQGEFHAQRPLEGIRISACLHITTETANLARALKAGGAEMVLVASNPLSTQDDVAASLVIHEGIPVFAIRGEDEATYYRNIETAIEHQPHIVMDDGADLIATLHQRYPDRLAQVLGGTEETTTGVVRLRAMERQGALGFPVIAVNDALTKHLFDNRYGSGQSTLDGILRATHILLAGKVFTVAGYGWCGKGLAMRAKGMGARVVVTEVDPLKALEAAMDGFQVMPMVQAAAQSDFIVTVTGNKHVVDRMHLEVMKDGCILANSGHFDVEINLPALEAMAVERRQPRPWVEEYRLRDGRMVRLLARGRLVNLVAAEGHPSAVMDMSFANQALSVRHLAAEGKHLERKVYPVPEDIDAAVARHKLEAMGLAIDALSEEQKAYLSSWQEGT